MVLFSDNSRCSCRFESLGWYERQKREAEAVRRAQSLGEGVEQLLTSTPDLVDASLPLVITLDATARTVRDQMTRGPVARARDELLMIVQYDLLSQRSKRITGVQFGMLSPETIEKLSVVEIDSTTIYNRGVPHRGGINDSRMGTVDRRVMCSTCGLDVARCPGHIGHIRLATPCYHIGFCDTAVKVLRSVCFICSALGVTSAEKQQILAESSCKVRFLMAYTMARNKKKCPSCGFTRPNYVRLPLGIRCDWPANTAFSCDEEESYCRAPFTAAAAQSILKHMTDEDVTAIGFCPREAHPRDLILTHVVVPPPIARPAIMASEGSRSRGQDDLTHKLQDINKRNIDVSAALHKTPLGQKPSADVLDRIAKLQYEVFSFMSNNIRGHKPTVQRSGVTLKSVADRIKGKDGRIRGNLMGKRVNFSARSVISPDPLMAVDEIGVPYSIAKGLTVQERVQPHNVRELTERVHNGPDSLHGAETVITADGLAVHLGSCEDRRKIRLVYGMIVERFLKNGDLVIFNRQPSLHRMGMLAHRVVLMPGSTLRLNLSCNAPYNADFDGDEMNVHVVQSTLAQVELRYLLAVSRQIISPQASRPVLGIVQDSLLGCYLLTSSVRLFSREEFMDLMAWMQDDARNLVEPPVPAAVLFPDQRWTGQQVFSCLFPRGFYHGRWSVGEDHVPDADCVVIEAGQLLCGTLNKQYLGTSSGGIVDVLCRDYGRRCTVQFLTSVQRVINYWLASEGFSIGIKDCVLREGAEDSIVATLTRAFAQIDAITRDVTDVNLADSAEHLRVEILSKILMSTAATVEKNMPAENCIRKTVRAGSKGNPVNMSQICGCVGQQSVEGKRLFADNGTRNLPCFEHCDVSVNSRGFVQNSYAIGLSPDEFFFHAMGGREGLVDTAVKTATTGYIQRRQMKAMEDNRVHYDDSVRIASTHIIEFLYGGDGMDPTNLERQRLPFLVFNDARVRSSMVSGLERTVAVEEQQAARVCELLRRIRSCRAGIFADIAVYQLLPFNVSRLDAAVRRMPRAATPLDAQACAEFVDDVLRRCKAVICHRFDLVELVVLWTWSARAIRERLLSVEALQWVGDKVVESIRTGRVAAGEAVGSIAAQSIGEPCTQMTLNTFHFAGCGSKNVTLGIPRFKELLDGSRNIRTPCTTFLVRAPLSDNVAFVERMSQRFVHRRLQDVVSKMQMVHEDEYLQTSVAADERMVWLDARVNAPQLEGYSRIVTRCVLDQRIMKNIGMLPCDLLRIVRAYDPGLHVVASATNEVNWVLRLRFRDVGSMMARVSGARAESLERTLVTRISGRLLDCVVISGVEGIREAHCRSLMTWDERTQANKSHVVIDLMGEQKPTALAFSELFDWYSCHSNDVNQVYQLLGIEAAYAVIYHELMTTLTFDGGAFVNHRHCSMIVNTMTYRGYVMPISRHGLNRRDNSPLVRCSFEETVDTLFDAAMYAEQDNAQGVTQNVMTGKLSQIGTGSFDVADACGTGAARGDLPPRRVLVKSMRGAGASVPRHKTSLEYINPNVWLWNGTHTDETCITPFAMPSEERTAYDGDVEKPYNDARDTCRTDSGSTAVVKPSRFFEPSSPRALAVS